MFNNKIIPLRKVLKDSDLDGWLLYDFRKSNELACHFLEISPDKMCTRRFFYWIPQAGTPVKIVHRIESHTLSHLPGTTVLYSSWEELEMQLKKTLQEAKRLAMEYSPKNAIPTISKVDAGTIDLVRSFGIEVQSSADLLQHYTSVWTAQQLRTHIEAAAVLDTAVTKAWQFINTSIRAGQAITEYDVQRLILDEYKQNGCIAEVPPICAVNVNSADPHYLPSAVSAASIKSGDFVLIDLWCKKKSAQAVYADITRVGVVAPAPTKRQLEIFNIVKEARDAAMQLLKERLAATQAIMGWELDQACRDVIVKAGYGEFFTHRTGHNIGERDHGDGANIDNFETKDCRFLLAGTCFSIEPGIYLPGEFGVRLEHDVYLELDGKHFQVSQGLQTEIVCMG